MPIGPIFRAMTHNRTRVVLIILEIAVTLAIVTNCVNMIVDERSKMLPDVPTVSEAGLPGFVSRGWLGVAAPAKTPKPIIDKLNAAIRKALETPSVADRLTELGLQVKPTSPSEFATFIDQEINNYRNIITSAKITID